MYALYDVKDEIEPIIAIFDTAQDAADYFLTSKDCIYCAVSRGSLLRGKYKIYKVDGCNFG